MRCKGVINFNLRTCKYVQEGKYLPSPSTVSASLSSLQCTKQPIEEKLLAIEKKGHSLVTDVYVLSRG